MGLQYGSRSADGRWWWDGNAWQPVPEQQYVAEQAGRAGTLPGVPPGPLGQPRNVVVCVLLAIVTLGIYTFVWVYKTQREVKDHADIGVGGGIGLLLYILVHIATYFLVASDVETLYRRRGHNPPVTVITGLWFLLPLLGSLIWFVKVQTALNDYWTALGAPPA